MCRVHLSRRMKRGVSVAIAVDRVCSDQTVTYKMGLRSAVLIPILYVTVLRDCQSDLVAERIKVDLH
jgi:hypothetical protein